MGLTAVVYPPPAVRAAVSCSHRSGVKELAAPPGLASQPASHSLPETRKRFVANGANHTNNVSIFDVGGLLSWSWFRHISRLLQVSVTPFPQNDTTATAPRGLLHCVKLANFFFLSFLQRNSDYLAVCQCHLLSMPLPAIVMKLNVVICSHNAAILCK